MRGNRGNTLQGSKSSTSNEKCYRCIRADGDLLFQHPMVACKSLRVLIRPKLLEVVSG
jgi:hypothetical protein